MKIFVLCSFFPRKELLGLCLMDSALNSVADPGFPVGGRAPIRGGVDLQCWHFSVKMYA